MTDRSKEPTMHTFQTPGPARLRVEIPKGRVHVTAADIAETTIELKARPGDAAGQAMVDEAEIAQHGDEIVVIVKKRLGLFGWGPGVEATVRAPVGTAAILATGSGAIETDGRLGDLKATSGSGAIRIADGGEVSAHTGSGDI
ncbi:MAG TPA: hypothetical protein VG939_02795, partial [Caulobacteraceae bacterium]|nr:hypothetical protein [Caulobacteraceae bacterium]